VADPGCLSKIPDPDFYPSRIPDPKTGRKKGVKKIFLSNIFLLPKCKIILFLNCSRKKFGPNFKELWNFLPKKLSLNSQKYEFGIQGSKRHPIPDPGSGSATLKIRKHAMEL
jgi:hypothetical protein